MTVSDARPPIRRAPAVSGTERAVMQAIEHRRSELVELSLALSALPDLSGHERPVAEAVATWLHGNGIESTLQELGPESANVIATVPGVAAERGSSLMLEAHLDTEGADGVWEPDERLRLRGAWQEGELLIGKGLVNDKVQLAAMMVAIVVARDTAGPLAGDLLLVGAAQETGRVQDPADPGASVVAERGIAGPHVLENQGARELVARGIAVDYALVGEPNGFAIGAAQAGYVRLRVDVPGSIPYTPFVQRHGPHALANPFERAGRVLQSIETWCGAFQEQHRFSFWGGTVVGTAQVQGIEGSGPLFTERTDWCRIYVDIRMPPGDDPDAIADEVRAAAGGHGFDCPVFVYDLDIGHVAVGAERLVDALRRSHRTVFGEDPSEPHAPQISMSQDMNVFNAAGIPSVAYGIRPVVETFTREGMRAARIDDVVALAQVYALTARSVCGVE